MLEQVKDASERWGGVHAIIDRWLAERKELIVALFEIQGNGTFVPESEPVEQRIQRFCEILVDYVSAGHFEVYEQLIREAQAFDDVDMDQAQAIVGHIQENTELVLAFNDNYADVAETRQHLNELASDLSRLGENLEERFALEDRLIQDLHEVHRPKAVSEG